MDGEEDVSLYTSHNIAMTLPICFSIQTPHNQYVTDILELELVEKSDQGLAQPVLNKTHTEGITDDLDWKDHGQGGSVGSSVVYPRGLGA